MNLRTQILRPAARIAGWHAHRQTKRFLHACRHGRQTQDELLARLIAYGADTRFGRDHGLAGVRTYDDFTRAVPIGDYDSLSPYLNDVFEGDSNAMFPPGEKVLMFALTSGTTGRPKHIPITTESIAQYRRGWNIFGFKMLGDHPHAWLKPILQISSPAVEHLSPAGVPCGAISGLLAKTQKKIVRRMYVVGPDVMALDDPVAKYYAIMRLAVPRDIRLISTANPSTIIKMMGVAREHLDELLRDLRDGTLTGPTDLPAELVARLPLRKHPALVRRLEQAIQRDGELLYSHFWTVAVMAHWTGGTLGLYLPEVRRLIGPSAGIRDIGLLASEGRFSLPLDDDTPSGVADVMASLLEFIPADQIDDPAPTVLRSHQLDEGGEYFLVFTNFSGLWRYNINDRIRVTGRLGETPLFAFLDKGDHTTSLTGEKLTEHQVVTAMARACRKLNTAINQFITQPHFDQPPYYLFTIEPNTVGADRLSIAVDKALSELNIEYASKRHTGRLGPVRFAEIPPGSFARREREILHARSGRTEQYKHQYLLTEVVIPAAAHRTP